VEVGVYMISDVDGAHTWQLKKLLVAFVENQATFNIRSTGNNWTGAGGLSDGNDRSSTVSASLATDTISGYKVFSHANLIADVQSIVDGGPNNGWHLGFASEAGGSGNYWQFGSREGTDGQRPYIGVTYTAGGAAALTGTATATIDETAPVAGGDTVIYTLTGETFIAA